MAMRVDSELMVITKSKNLIDYVIAVSENAPKKFRFTLITKMQNLSLSVLEDLILANEIMLGKETDNAQRRNLQHKAIANLKVLDAVAMIAIRHECILPKHYENISKLIAECIKLTGAWLNSDSRRLNNMK